MAYDAAYIPLIDRLKNILVRASLKSLDRLPSSYLPAGDLKDCKKPIIPIQNKSFTKFK
jgi:predicted nuclease with TOPRIM domain